MDRGEGKMLVVRESDPFHAFGLRPRKPQRAIHQRYTVFVAALAGLDPGRSLVNGMVNLAVTSRTAQALRLSRPTAFDIEMFQMLEAHDLTFTGHHYQKGQASNQGASQTRRNVLHGSPPSAAPAV
jgi:hypothetical protein